MDCVENVREIQNADENKGALLAEPTDGSSIYHYMKEHPGFFTALMSALVAVIAFVLNAAEYRRISGYLKYWGFNAEIMQIDAGNHIYILAFAFVFIIALAGVILFLNQTFNVFQKQENVLFYLRIADKYLRHKMLKIRLDNLRLQLSIWFYSKKDADVNRIAELKRRVHEQNLRLDELKEEVKSRQKTIGMLKRKNVIRLVPSLFITCGLLLLLLGLTGVTDELKVSVRYPNLVLCIFVLILIGLMYYVARFENRAERKRIKKMLKNEDKSAYTKIEELAEQNRKIYPVEWIFRSKAEELFNNKTLTLIALLVIVCLFYAFAIFSDASEATTVSKRIFSVVDIDGQEYVITYSCDTTYYLNEAEIDSDQNSINIYTKKQRVVASDDMVYDIVEFKSVEVDPPLAESEDRQQSSETSDSSIAESE